MEFSNLRKLSVTRKINDAFLSQERNRSRTDRVFSMILSPNRFDIGLTCNAIVKVAFCKLRLLTFFLLQPFARRSSSTHRCSLRFHSELKEYQNSNLILFFFDHSFVATTVYFRSSLCWNLNLSPWRICFYPFNWIVVKNMDGIMYIYNSFKKLNYLRLI